MGAEPFSKRDSMMLSPICPGLIPSTDITHTVTPSQGEEEEHLMDMAKHLSVQLLMRSLWDLSP